MTTTASKRGRRKRDESYYFKVYPSHGIEMLERLNEQRTSDTLCDVTVHVEDDQFRAHRCMLAASCETFKQLICKHPRNDLNMTSNIKSKAFIVILNYIYTGSVTLEEDCVDDVMFAAKYFNLPNVEKSCKKFLNQLYHYRKRNKTINQCEAFESKLGNPQNTERKNHTELKCKKSVRNGSTSSISDGNLLNPDISCRKNTINAVGVGIKEIELIEPKVEIEGESEMISHSELVGVCAYVGANQSYDDCLESRDISAISVQTLNGNTSDDILLESVLAQVNVNQDSFMKNLFNESDRSNVCIKRETVSPPLENNQKLLVKKTCVQNGKDIIRKRIKTSSIERGKERVRKPTKMSSVVKRDKERDQKYIQSPVVFLDDDSDTVVFGDDFEDNGDNLNIVMPLNGLTKTEQPLPNSIDSESNLCDNQLQDSLTTDNRVLKDCRRPRKESKMVKKIKYSQNDSISSTQNESPSLICTICNQRFFRKCNLTRHQYLHNLETFTCQQCNEQFNSIVKFKRHSIGVHAIRECFGCPHEGCNFKSQAMWSLKQHSLTHSNVKHFQCVTCGKSFTQYSGLRMHLRSCLQEKSFLCDFCGVKFNHQQELVTHLRVHTGERPYQCDMCSAQFTDNPNYKRHRRIHENAFPYSCHLCDKKFRHSNSLKAHMVNH